MLDSWLTAAPGALQLAQRGWPCPMRSVVRAAGCEMTPDEEPLMCSCGGHSARLQPPRSTKRKWQIFAVKKSGHKPQIVTMRAKKDDALAIVRELCGGSYEKRNQPRTAPAAQAEPSSRSLRKRKHQSQDETAATKPAGPGRGHKGPRRNDTVHHAERVLQKSNASNEELRYALQRTVKECKSL